MLRGARKPLLPPLSRNQRESRRDPMPEASSEELLRAALEISETAAAIPMQYFRSPIAVEDKPDETPVTVADRETEAHIRARHRRALPGVTAYSARSSEGAAGGADNTWIIDPIDGTRSFICGIPLFGMLIGVLARRRCRSPGVIRMPALGRDLRRLPRRQAPRRTARRSAAATTPRLEKARICHQRSRTAC